MEFFSAFYRIFCCATERCPYTSRTISRQLMRSSILALCITIVLSPVWASQNTESPCPSRADGWSYSRLDLMSVGFQLFPLQGPNRATEILVGFHLPPGSSVTLTSNDWIFESFNGERLLTILPAAFDHWVVGLGTMSKYPMDRNTELRSENKSSKSIYRLIFSVPDTFPNEFRLRIPSLRDSHGEFTVPPVGFQRNGKALGLKVCPPASL